MPVLLTKPTKVAKGVPLFTTTVTQEGEGDVTAAARVTQRTVLHFLFRSSFIQLHSPPWRFPKDHEKENKNNSATSSKLFILPSIDRFSNLSSKIATTYYF